MIEFPDDEYADDACERIAEAPSLDALDRLVSVFTLSRLGLTPGAYSLAMLRRVASTGRARQIEILDQCRLGDVARVEYEAARGGAR